MSGACQPALGDVQVLRDVVRVVDCNSRSLSEAGYHALTGPHSVFPTALTALLTIYVAILGYRLLFGGGGLSLADAPVAAVKIGVILALTMSWITFQTLVFDVAFKAPLEVARMISGPAARTVDPLIGAQAAYTELSLDAIEFGKQAGSAAPVAHSPESAAADGLWKASGALFAGTAGVLSVASIATGILTAIGPVFIALFLLDVTRGLFVGWIRALAATVLAPTVCWLTTTPMLIALNPWLMTLADQRRAHQLNPQTATAAVAMVFVFAAAQAALVIASGVIAAGFQLSGRRRRAETQQTSPQPQDQSAPLAAQSRAQHLAQALQRSIPAGGSVERRISVERSVVADGGARGEPAADRGSQRTVRLGENYRRGRFQDRLAARPGSHASGVRP